MSPSRISITASRNLRFYQIHKIGLKIGIEPPIKIESLSPNNICFLFGSYIISHFSPFVNPEPPKNSIFTLKNEHQCGIIRHRKAVIAWQREEATSCWTCRCFLSLPCNHRLSMPYYTTLMFIFQCKN